MPYTFEDFDVDYILEHLPELPRERQREVLERLPPGLRQQVLQSLPIEQRLADLSEEQIREYLDQRAVSQPTPSRGRRRKRQ